MISPLIDRAVGFAVQAHAGQQRKSGDMPYIAHLVGVAMILLEMGCPATIVAAGLLHDVVEDTSATLHQLQTEFGSDVAAIVAGCTEPSGLTWEERKLNAIARFRDASLPVKLVVAADKYHNLYHMQRNREKVGENVWQRFSRGSGQQAWYYRSVVESLMLNNAYTVEYPIFAELSDVVEVLFDGIVSQPPTSAM
jgi:(p)ppGpp synthase/HD superfamily hydrolase